MKEETYCIKFRYRPFVEIDIRKMLNQFKELVQTIEPGIVEMDIRGCT